MPIQMLSQLALPPLVAAIPVGDVVMVAVGVGVIAFLAWRHFSARRSTPRPTAADTLAPKDRLVAMADRARQADMLERLIKEAEQVTKIAAQQLDAKSARLEKLIAEADIRITAMRAMEQAIPTPEPKPARSPSYRMIETLASPIIPASVEPERQPPIVEIPAPDSLTQRVLDMADAGRSPVEIARELEEHPGKIELMLALRSSRRGRPIPAASAPVPRT